MPTITLEVDTDSMDLDLEVIRKATQSALNSVDSNLFVFSASLTEESKLDWDKMIEEGKFGCVLSS